MAEILEVDGVPVILGRMDFPPYRFKFKKKESRKFQDMPLKKLSPKAKKALEIKAANPLMPNRQVGKLAGYHPQSAKRAVDNLSKRKKIQKILDRRAPDVRIGQELSRLAFDSEHPLSKEEKPDNMARLGALKEINKIKDNYPPKEIHLKGLVAHVDLTPDDHNAYQRYVELVQEGSDQEGA